MGCIEQSRQDPELVQSLKSKGIIKGSVNLWPEESLRRIQYHNSKKDNIPHGPPLSVVNGKGQPNHWNKLDPNEIINYGLKTMDRLDDFIDNEMRKEYFEKLSKDLTDTETIN